MPGSRNRLTRLTLAVALGLATTFAAVDMADARRAMGGSSFGSRGARTWQAPAPTPTAPGAASPIQRSMTPNTGPTTQQPGMAQPAQRPGLFGGFGRSMLGGLVAGGLLGMFLGHGFGGVGGVFSMLLQLAIFAFLGMFLLRLFANRSAPQPSAAGGPQAGFGGRPPSVNPLSGPLATAFGGSQAAPAPDESIEVQQADLDRFEQILVELQSAYGREDYAALRNICTPEAMSYLAEEMGELASHGKRNEVKDVKLLQGDISEAWREGDTDYATVAMRYSSIDVLVDRTTGKVLEGDPNAASEAVEVWTFARKNGGPWKVSAIQDAH